MAEPCPSCGGEVPDESVWLLRGRFYCKESCAAMAAARKVDPVIPRGSDLDRRVG